MLFISTFSGIDWSTAPYVNIYSFIPFPPPTPPGMASIVKCVIGIHNEKIPANLHFNTPNPNILSLHDGRVKVVTEPRPFPSGFISISSFGVGGSNYNAVLK